VVGGSFFCVFLALCFCPPSCSFSFSLFCFGFSFVSAGGGAVVDNGSRRFSFWVGPDLSGLVNNGGLSIVHTEQWSSRGR
jgi:hypothetical protein